jgi:hypothetical protein
LPRVALTPLQLFSLREHLLTVEKQRDAKAQEAIAWAARAQEVQDDCNTQMSYQQIEIQVRFFLCCCTTHLLLPHNFTISGPASALPPSREAASGANAWLLQLLQQR